MKYHQVNYVTVNTKNRRVQGALMIKANDAAQAWKAAHTQLKEECDWHKIISVTEQEEQNEDQQELPL